RGDPATHREGRRAAHTAGPRAGRPAGAAADGLVYVPTADGLVHAGPGDAAVLVPGLPAGHRDAAADGLGAVAVPAAVLRPESVPGVRHRLPNLSPAPGLPHPGVGLRVVSGQV